MQIDPNLQKLQSLINSKQAQHIPDGNRIGRTGNPKFAEAVRRAQSARMGNGFQENRIQPQSSNIQLNSVKRVPVKTEEIQSVSSDKLIASNLNGTINIGQTTQIRRTGSLDNVGKHLDLYA